ncbi:hypothetical protein C8J56DRAFT_192899 [Mycena floridula]|nr:hypothetical protein C8J56DRAFT_192899 [Mycena floridula]
MASHAINDDSENNFCATRGSYHRSRRSRRTAGKVCSRQEPEVHAPNIRVYLGIECLRIRRNAREECHILAKIHACSSPSRMDFNPDLETLTAMTEMVTHNWRCPLKERKCFLTEFPDPEYEYIFLPVDIQEEIIVYGGRFLPPYADFPRIKCNANPFFIAYHCESQVILADVCPTGYFNAYRYVSSDWHASYPKSFIGEPESSESDSIDDETHWGDSGEEDSVPAPALPPPSRTPVTKKSRIANWVNSNADPKFHEPALEPLQSPLKARKPRPDSKAAWRRDSALGQRWIEQLFE